MVYCCVPQCSASQKRGGAGHQLSFHRFPKHPSERREWIAKIRGVTGPRFQIKDNTRVCSKHFTKECVIRTFVGLSKLKPGSMPSLFPWNAPPQQQPVQSCNGDSEVEGEKMAFPNLNKGLSSSLHNSHHGWLAVPDHDYLGQPMTAEEQLAAARKRIACLEEEKQNLQIERFCLERIQCEPKLIKFYTGFQDYNTLKAVYLALKPTAVHLLRWRQMQRFNHSEEDILNAAFHAEHLCLFDQFFLFLCRVRQGFFATDLAMRFNVSQATVSRNCTTWGNYLFFMLGTLPVWPSRAAVNETMAPFFRNNFPKTRVVLDCAELHIQTACSKVLNAPYKSKTLKSLIGISPSGSISLVGNLYTASISDKDMTRESGILTLLEPGDEVIVSKDLLIKDMLADINVKLVIPACFVPSGQFSQDAITDKQEIVRLRVHVEMVIGRIKEYRIFEGVMPLSLCGTVNQLWTVCALLTNFQAPLF